MRAKLNFTPMALPTSVILLLLGFGVFFARPGFPLRRYFASDTGTGTIVRRLLPSTIVFTFLFGLVILDSRRAGYFTDASAMATYATAVAGFTGFLIIWIAARLYDVDMRRELAEASLQKESNMLRESKELLSLFIENSPVALAMFDREMRYLAISPRWKTDYGLGDQNVIGRSHYDVFPEIPECWKVFHQRGMNGEILRAEEDRFERADGSVQWLQWEIWPWHKADGSVGGIVLVTQDITARKSVQDELYRAAREIEDLYNHAPCGYHSLGKDGLFLRINDTELSWLGYTRDEVIGKLGWKDIISPAYFKVLEDHFPTFLRLGSAHDLEYEMVRKDGTTFIGLVNATAVHDANGNYLSSRGVLLDITAKHQLEAKLEQQAHTDALTGLNNRRYFFELAEQEMSRSKRFNEPLALLMFDVDHFKRFNDTYGHDIGDAVLKDVGAGCLETLRDIDILGRLGGEEFAVLLPGVSGDGAVQAGERLRVILSKRAIPVRPDEDVYLTVSVGVAVRSGTEDNIAAMMKRADNAMYVAKGAGRNCVRLAGQ